MPPVPGLDRLPRIVLEHEVALADLRFDPAGLVPDHQLGARRRDRQRRIDHRGKWMDEVRPFRTEHPQRARTFTAEIPLTAGGLAVVAVGIEDFRPIDAYRAATFDRER